MEAQARRTQPVLCYHCVFFSLYHLVTRSPPPPPSSSHCRLTFSLVVAVVSLFPPTSLRPLTRGEAPKRGDATMTRAPERENVWPFCVAVREVIVSPKQWRDANSQCSYWDHGLLTMKTLFASSRENFFPSFDGCFSLFA